MGSTSALRQEIEDLRWLFETPSDLIFATEGRGTFTHVSRSAEAILGYRPDEMIGRSGADFIYPEDLEPTRDAHGAPRSAYAQL